MKHELLIFPMRLSRLPTLISLKKWQGFPFAKALQNCNFRFASLTVFLSFRFCCDYHWGGDQTQGFWLRLACKW